MKCWFLKVINELGKINEGGVVKTTFMEKLQCRIQVLKGLGHHWYFSVFVLR